MTAANETTSEETYERELHVAVELARAAGAAALTHYGGPLTVEHKGAYDEPVTQADHEANELIVRGLHESFPDDGILAEESVDTERRLTKKRVWMVDPLDGTKGFIARSGDFAVQIGLTVGGDAVLGVVYQPASGVLYRAVRGRGAWVERPDQDAQRMHVSTETNLTSMRLAASRSHRSPRMDKVVRALGLKNETQRNSVGVKVGLIAERHCDLYIHLGNGTKQWDTCAPEVVLREAGGIFTDIWGEPFSYNTPDVLNRNGIVASNGVAHDSIIKRLAPLLVEFGRVRE